MKNKEQLEKEIKEVQLKTQETIEEARKNMAKKKKDFDEAVEAANKELALLREKQLKLEGALENLK